uniref:Reverse transcriptase domain-containing protein n=1 Tax=Tanacetum cinerariifolium TaxID=118510 RepID=A0A6L2L1Q1_TANCI|nr:reverse transcriptase domain-containing protein [Tanacetum cinerariifolium]
MRTRNSYFPNNSSVTIPRRRNKRRTPNVVEPEFYTIIEMADNHTMEELLQAPTEGYGEAIVIPEINADHFEIKTNFLQMVQANPYHGFERENPYTHINNFKRVTSTLKFRDVSNDVIKLMMFPYSLEGNARVWENASKTDDRIDKLADQILTLVDIFAKKVVTPSPVKAVEKSCVTCGGAHAYYNCLNTDSNQPSVWVATGTYNQVAPQNRGSNYMAPPGFAPSEMKAITTRSGVAYEGPLIPTPKKVMERETEETTDKEQTNFQGSTAYIQPPVTPILEPDVLKTLPKPNIPYPLRLNDQKLRKKATNQMEKTGRALIDVYREEITLRVNDKARGYAQEFLGFSNNSSGGNPTSTSEPILSNSSLSLTPFEGSGFILEEIDAYLTDESVSPEIDHANCDLEGDICLIEKLLNDDPFHSL